MIKTNGQGCVERDKIKGMVYKENRECGVQRWSLRLKWSCSSLCEAQRDPQPCCSPHGVNLRGSALTRAVLILCVWGRTGCLCLFLNGRMRTRQGRRCFFVSMFKSPFSQEAGGNPRWAEVQENYTLCQVTFFEDSCCSRSIYFSQHKERVKSTSSVGLYSVFLF